MRLLSLIAIKDQNAALAGMIKKATETTDALQTFRQAIIDAIKALISMVNAELAKLQQQFPATPITGGGGGVSSNYDPGAVSGGMPGSVLSMPFSAGTFRAAEAATTNIVVNVGGSVTTERDLVSAITQGIYNNQASGIPISYTTAYR
jgi:prefoldin subunit 5